MKKVLFALSCLVAIGFAACDKLPEESVVLTGPDSLTLSADETSSSFSFTAIDAWSATVESGAEWLSIDPASGDAAGEYTVTVTASANTEEKSRVATVRLICRQFTLTVTVTQKGVNEEDGDGEGEEGEDINEVAPPFPFGRYEKLVERIKVSYEYWEDYDEEDLVSTVNYLFRYDTKGRMTGYDIVVRDPKEDVAALRNVGIEYLPPYQVRITETGSGDYAATCLLDIKQAGQPEKLTYTYTPTGATQEYQLSYHNDTKQLLQLTWGNGSHTNEYIYYDGVISEMVIDGDPERIEGLTVLYDYDRPNLALNVDVSPLFLSLDHVGGLNGDASGEIPGFLDRLAMIRLAGRGSLYSMIMEALDPFDYYDPNDEVYRDPNLQTHRSVTYYVDDDYATLEYVYDGEGNVQTITRKAKVYKYVCEYDVKVGHDFRDPSRPELGYEFEITNEKTESLGSGINTRVYRFTYSDQEPVM